MRRNLVGLFIMVIAGGLMNPETVYGAVSCDYTIPVNVSIADGRGNYAGVQPGDTVCILAGNRDSLKLRNFLRDTSTPITFINFGGQVVINSTTSEGILVQNSKFIKITGTGDTQVKYGIKIIHSTANGMTMPNKTSDFEVDHIEVSGVPIIGVSAKTEAVCSDGSTSDWHAYDYDGDGIKVGDLDDVVNRSNFTQINSIFHDNYVHDVGTEGFYIGSSFYQGRSLSCNSGTEYVDDPVLRGVKVYNNVVDRTGWDGIQVGSAVSEVDIHHNIVRDAGLSSDPSAGNGRFGMIINRGTTGNYYNNQIYNSRGSGMYIQGIGGYVIYNNIFYNSGMATSAQGINWDLGDGGMIYNNTIVKSSRSGIRVSSTPKQGAVYDNLIAETLETGVVSNYVNAYNNLVYGQRDAVKFKDPSQLDFHLTVNSPAIDQGSSSGYAVRDIDDQPRPQDGNGDGIARSDVGADEYMNSAPSVTPRPTPTIDPRYEEITPDVSRVRTSGDDGTNLSGNTVDNDLSTRWSASGDGQWIEYDLGVVRTVGLVRIGVYQGDSRMNKFDLQVSSDRVNWETVWSGESSGMTLEQEVYDFSDIQGRYVRYLGHINNTNEWNSLTEVDIYGIKMGLGKKLRQVLGGWFDGLLDQNGDGKVNTIDWGKVVGGQ